MLFYFSGTGNSLMAAKAVANKGEQIVNMATARRVNNYAFDIKGERIGFVFPVYCFTLSDVVLDFVRNLKIERPEYVFAIITCGGGMGGAGKFLTNEFKKKGIHLDYVTQLVMPDDTVFYYDIEPKEKTDDIINKAKDRLIEIKKDLDVKKNQSAKGISSKYLRPIYHLIAGTKKFYVTDDCIGCGMCAKNCPDEVIGMKNNKPIWMKKHCAKCSACINRCPKSAIQYGKATEKRLRYINPVLRGGKK